MRNSFQTIEKWVLCENTFKQLLLTHPVVLTEEGENQFFKILRGASGANPGEPSADKLFLKSNHSSKMLSAFLHPSHGNPKSGLKYIIYGGSTMHPAQHILDMDVQSSCISGQAVYLNITLPNSSSTFEWYDLSDENLIPHTDMISDNNFIDHA